MSEPFNHGYAVVIGMGADLPVTMEDANGVATLLGNPARCAYPGNQVQLLRGSNAKRDDVLTALDHLAQQTKHDPDAVAIVYFSGHGVEMPDYYLLPNGYKVSDLPGTAISGAEFTEKLRAVAARKLLVLLDCCHAGGIGEAKDLPFAKSPAPPEVFDTLKVGSGRVIIASSRKDEKSYTGQPYSVFTAELLKALAGYGAFEKDGYARVLDTAMWLGRKVPARTGEKQNPIIKVSNLEDNFALAYYAGGDKFPKSFDWDTGMPISTDLDETQIRSWRDQWKNYRFSLMLIEGRMSEYVMSTEVPLQLVREKQIKETQISELMQRLNIDSL